jgi:SAM-dependent methyltransferase
LGADTRGYIDSTEASDIARQWSRYKGFTVRPLKSTEDFYDRYVGQHSTADAHVMIYGGTPELRDCTFRRKRATTIVDRSALMVRAMGLLTECGEALAPHERFFECDWRRIPVPSRSFDLLMGDDAINMMAWPCFPDFLDESCRVLKDGGVFVCHLLVKPDDRLIDQALAEVFAEYRRGVISNKYDLASRINFVHYDRSGYMMGWQRSIRGLNEALRTGLIGHDEGFSDHFRLCHSAFACPPRDEFERLLLGRYEILDVCHPVEYEYCRFEPLYVLKKVVA